MCLCACVHPQNLLAKCTASASDTIRIYVFAKTSKLMARIVGLHTIFDSILRNILFFFGVSNYLPNRLYNVEYKAKTNENETKNKKKTARSEFQTKQILPLTLNRLPFYSLVSIQLDNIRLGTQKQIHQLALSSFGARDTQQPTTIASGIILVHLSPSHFQLSRFMRRAG